MPATYYIHIGLQWKVGDHTTLHTVLLLATPTSDLSLPTIIKCRRSVVFGATLLVINISSSSPPSTNSAAYCYQR